MKPLQYNMSSYESERGMIRDANAAVALSAIQQQLRRPKTKNPAPSLDKALNLHLVQLLVQVDGCHEGLLLCETKPGDGTRLDRKSMGLITGFKHQVD